MTPEHYDTVDEDLSDGTPVDLDDETTKPHRPDPWEEWLTMWLELGLAYYLGRDLEPVEPSQGWEDRCMERLRSSWRRS